MKASETMPEVPSNSALMPSLSICERMRTPIGREPAEIDDLRIERLDLREFGGEVLLVGGDAEGADDLGLAQAREGLAEILVVALAVVGGVMDHRDGLVTELGDQRRVGFILVDHRAVDAMNLCILVAVGDVGKDSPPHDHRKAELVVGVDGRYCGRRAVVRRSSNDLVVGGHLGRGLHGDVRLAFVVEHDELVVVFGLCIGVAQLHRQIGRVAAADAVDRDTAGQRPDEADLDRVLGGGRSGETPGRAPSGPPWLPCVSLSSDVPGFRVRRHGRPHRRHAGARDLRSCLRSLR